MKKLLTVLLTVVMLFSALTAFAEEADATLNLADIGITGNMRCRVSNL